MKSPPKMPAALPLPLSVELRVQRPGLDIRAQFRVLPGRVCALVGRSGGGKSALLEAAAGLRPALGGRVAVGTEALYDSAAGLDQAPHQRRLGWLDAHGRLFPHLSVRANLAYALRHAPPRADTAALETLTQWLDLHRLLGLRPEQLTPAQTVRVALCRALLAGPRALLMDDPLGRVSEHERAPLLDVLAELPERTGLALVFASPRMNEVIRLADEVVVLHDGRMASAGPLTQVLSDVSLATFLEGPHAGSVIEGELMRHDIEWLLSEVDVGGQRVSVPAVPHAVGRKVRLKIRARDVNLHREPIEGHSASNQLRGRITHIMLAGAAGSYGAVCLELDRPREAGAFSSQPGVPLWALLTRRSIQQMQWEPGQPCVASFKAMSVALSSWR